MHIMPTATATLVARSYELVHGQQRRKQIPPVVGVAIYTDASCNKYFCVGHDLKKGELDKTYREIKMDE